jgi:HJR/Mrr/RecB family endonuclease
VILWLGVGLQSGIALVGFVGLLVGGVGLIGTRKAQAADNLRRSKIESVDAMTGTQFELYLSQLFAGKGYQVHHSGGRGDFGADLVLDGSNGRTIVQAKRWSALVGHAAIQEVVAARGHYQGQHAIVATNSYFSEHAKKLAQSNQVELWDRDRMAYEITQFAAVPPTPAPQRFGAELAAGAPVVFGSLLVILSSVSGNKRSKRPRRRR